MPNEYDYNACNPAIVPFEKIYVPYMNSRGQQEVREEYRIIPGRGYDILTEDVLNSGNLEVLKKFQEDHLLELTEEQNAPAKRYLDARIKNAQRVQAMQDKAKLFTALKKDPPKQEIVNQNGMIGFQNLKYPDYQTSSNGCWSIAYSTLLKSRGVNLSQEEVRQWRPDYKANMPLDQRANHERKRVMNVDDFNSIYPNADLVGQVLPNTAVNMMRLEPFETDNLRINGNRLTEEQKTLVGIEYLDQVKTRIKETITDALTTHQSPVAATWDGHFITITGITPDGIIEYEDSLGRDFDAPRTNRMSLDEMVNQGLSEHYNNYGDYFPRGQGIELTWLSDIPVKDVGQKQPGLHPDNENFVKVNNNGSVAVHVPLHNKQFSESGSPAFGQVGGKGVDKMLALDQDLLSEKWSMPKVTGIGFNNNILIGNVSTYYPGRVLRPGDMNLLREALTSQKQVFKDVHDGLSFTGLRIPTQQELRKYEEFRTTLNDLQDAADGKEIDIDKARETLSSMYDFMLEKPEGSNKTRFEDKFSRMNYNERTDLVEKMHLLNLSLGLGKDEATATLERLHENMEAEYRREVAKRDAETAFGRRITEHWDTVTQNLPYDNDKNSDQYALLQSSLAAIAANYTAYYNNIAAGKEPPFPKGSEVRPLMSRIQGSQAFQELLNGDHNWDYPTDFAKDYANADMRIKAERENLEKYKIPQSSLAQRQARFANIADSLDRTNTGYYTGLEVVSRRKNSTSFDNAKAAIRGLSTMPQPSPQDVKTAVETVRRYTDGKEKRRTRQFGRRRWHDCMRFLADTMPREEFEAYCKNINAIRDVQVGHPDYVSPEHFYPQLANANYIINDSITRIRENKNTLRDYARVIAVSNYANSNGETLFDGVRARNMLARDTENILKDPRFASFIGQSDKQFLVELMQGGGANFKAVWNSYKEANPTAEERARQSGTNRQVQQSSLVQPSQPSQPTQNNPQGPSAFQ